MNIASLTNAYAATQAALRPAELNSVGQNVLSEGSISSRPVPALDKTSALGLAPGQLSSDPTNLQRQQVPGQEQSQEARNNERREQAVLKQEQDQIRQLAARDREVRAHEQAHASVGGQYAGAPSYQYQRGPDGVRYAVGGEVSIDVSKANTPEETIRKMQVVRRAALAPSEPSPQDRRVAAQAAATEAQARQELSELTRDRLDTSQTQDASAAATVGDSESAFLGKESEVNLGAEASIIEGSKAGINPVLNLEPFRPALPPSAINGLLQRSILATDETRQPGRLFDQLA